MTDKQAVEAYFAAPNGPWSAEVWVRIRRLFEQPDIAKERERCYAPYYAALARRGFHSGSDDGNGAANELTDE